MQANAYMQRLRDRKKNYKPAATAGSMGVFFSHVLGRAVHSKRWILGQGRIYY